MEKIEEILKQNFYQKYGKDKVETILKQSEYLEEAFILGYETCVNDYEKLVVHKNFGEKNEFNKKTNY